MPLVPYEPLRHLDNMRRDLERFFTSGFPSAHAFGLGQGFDFPRIDVHETGNEIVAACDIPGLEKKEDVDIDIENNILTISGTVSKDKEINEDRMHRQERFVGRFQRSVTLPARVESEGIRAAYRNGVLEIRMPKLTADIKKKIDVEFQ